jgi:hypothetical protein
MNQFEDDIKKIMALANSYAERHQILYSDVHARMIQMVVEETVKVIGNKILNLNKDETT